MTFDEVLADLDRLLPDYWWVAGTRLGSESDEDFFASVHSPFSSGWSGADAKGFGPSPASALSRAIAAAVALRTPEAPSDD